MQIQSHGRKVMQKQNGKYIPIARGVRKLNATVPPISVKSTNNKMNMKSKAFSVKRRTQNGPTNTSEKAVSKVTSGGVKGAARAYAYPAKLGSGARVTQISPAQRGSKTSPTSKTVASSPRMQNKKPVSKGKAPTYLAVKNSLRKTMGY